MLKKTITICTLLLGSIFTAAASASTAFYSQGIYLTGEATFIPGDTGFWWLSDTNDLSVLPQFNPSMGTLTSATLNISGDLDTFIELEGF